MAFALTLADETDHGTAVPMTHRPADASARVAIVGGGFSGTLALVSLIHAVCADRSSSRSSSRSSATTLTIDWFEPDHWCEGIAYRTTNPAHLLNVRAARMSALADNPGHLLDWLHTSQGRDALARAGVCHAVTGDSYIPRCVYACYLKHLLDETLALASQHAITVHQHHTRVDDIQHTGVHGHMPPAFVTRSRGAGEEGAIQLRFHAAGIPLCIHAHAVILATGNLQRQREPAHLSPESGCLKHSACYVDDVWHAWPQRGDLQRVHELADDTEIVIIGTGLTMVDTVITLIGNGYRGHITAISRHGLLPNQQVHAAPWPAWNWIQDPTIAPRKVYGLLKAVRREVRAAMAQGHAWQSVFDVLRPATQTLWRQLEVTEQRKFMNRLLPFWSVHRHRMAPEIHAQIRTLQDSGRLQVCKGRIGNVHADTAALRITLHDCGQSSSRELHAALLINCTGPEYNIEASGNTLLKRMHDRGLIVLNPLRVGIGIHADGSAAGNAHGLLFPVGALAVGELLECTAVPEIRAQVKTIARQVLRLLGNA